MSPQHPPFHRSRGGLWSVLWLVWISLACNPAKRVDILRVDNGVDISYAGRFANHPAFRSMLASIPEIRKEALERVKVRLGISPLNPDRIVIRFMDYGARGAGSGLEGWAAKRRLGSRKIFLVNVNLTEPLLVWRNIATLLAHEFAHAVMRQILEHNGRRDPLPIWFIEGTATWGAANLQNRLHDAFCSGIDPEKYIDGLERVELRASHRPSDYLEDALVFEYLARHYGLPAVHRLVRMVLDGADPPAAFETLCGVDWATLQERFRVFSIETLQAFDTEERLRLRRASVMFDQADLLLSQQRFEEARDLLLQNADAWRGISCCFLDRDYGEDWAHYQLGRCEAALGHREKAVEYFQKVVDNPTAGSTLVKQCQDWLRRLASGS